MVDFNTTLLREKFTIRDAFADTKPKREQETEPVIALSNRIVLPMVGGDNKITETIVVRAHNMHLCARMAARITQEFYEVGPIIKRESPFEWAYVWNTLVKGYEEKYNPNRWIAIYHKGRLIFKGGEIEHHSFLDIIEQCDARNPNNYEKAVNVAEDAFRQAGKVVTIEHDSNVAVVLNVTSAEARCGVIIRARRQMTFSYTARQTPGRPIKVSQCLAVAAAFLEGIQMAYQIGTIRQKIAYDMIDPGSPDVAKARDGADRIARLNGSIQQFEDIFDVTYRSERPEFSLMIDDAQAAAKVALAPELKKILEKGDVDKSGWVG